MHPADRPPPARPASALRTPALCCCLFAGLAAGLLGCPPARAQDREPPTLRLDRLVPGGARDTATESWGTFDFSLTNLSNADRPARLLVFYGPDEVQYGRDVWVPARSTLSGWMLVGPAAAQTSDSRRDIRVLLSDRSGGKDRLVPAPGEGPVHSRVVPYRKREPVTAVLLDEGAAEGFVPGRLPQPDSPSEEAVRLARVFRYASTLSEFVQVVPPGPLPPTDETFDGIDHFVIASGRIASDPLGLAALRKWLERGGKVWVMLDRVEPEAVAPLLGDSLDFQVVDRVTLTSFEIEARPTGQPAPEREAQQHERPVDIVRVLLPPGERVQHTVNGWPAWFTRQVGRGKVLFTTLGPRGWYRPHQRTDPPVKFEHFPSLPAPRPPLDALAADLRAPPEQSESFSPEAFQQPLTQEIGYSVVGRNAVAAVFGGFLLAVLALGLALRKSRRPELLGWLAPAAALGAAGAFVALGAWSHRGAKPTVAAGQIVDAVSGTPEASVHGLLAVYRPTSGPADLAASGGGLFEPNLKGTEGQAPRLVVTDLGAWHWENVGLPAGVRLAPFRYTAPTGEPIRAVARLGPDGLEGKLTAGPFREVADALLSTPSGRNLAVRLGPDGAFTAGSRDVLAPGHYLAGALLSDRQQRRQELYRTFLKRPEDKQPMKEGALLLAWARPIDMPFTLAPEARLVGDALLAVPLELERPAPGTRITIPGPLVGCRRMLAAGPTPVTLQSNLGMDMHLRFQLPAAVLPFRVERARLTARVAAPSRAVTVSGRADGKAVELRRMESPIDPIRIDITDERLLRPDADGGLHLNVTLGPSLQGGGKVASAVGEKWKIEYLELEVTGRTAAAERETINRSAASVRRTSHASR